MLSVSILILRLEGSRPVTQVTVGQDVVTMINVFAVAPDNQQQLIDLLVEGAERVMAKKPGYVSGHVHRSLDGTKVVVYAQWRSREDFQALGQTPRPPRTWAASERWPPSSPSCTTLSTRSSLPTTPDPPPPGDAGLRAS